MYFFKCKGLESALSALFQGKSHLLSGKEKAAVLKLIAANAAVRCNSFSLIVKGPVL